MMASPADRPWPGTALPAADSAVLLAHAREMQRETLTDSRQPWLRGKHIALVCNPDEDEPAALFSRAATELGAHVAQVHPFHDGTPTTFFEVQHIARLIGQLYDAIEWPHASSHLIEQLRAEAGIPVYDGLAAADHPTAQLADLLDAASPIGDRRRFVVQAVLLATIVK